MTFRPNHRARVYPSWADATRQAREWGYQVGWKYRVSRYRDGWIVRPAVPRRRAPVPVVGFMVNLGTGQVIPLT